MDTAEIAKRLLALHGEVKPQPPGDWTGEFPLPPAVEQFYREVGPANITIEGYGNGEMFPDLNSMAACLAQLGAIVLEFRGEYTDEDCFIRPKFRAFAEDRLQAILGNRSDAQSVLEVLGWG